jgi:hypothetical protein
MLASDHYLLTGWMLYPADLGKEMSAIERLASALQTILSEVCNVIVGGNWSPWWKPTPQKFLWQFLCPTFGDRSRHLSITLLVLIKRMTTLLPIFVESALISGPIDLKRSANERELNLR